MRAQLLSLTAVVSLATAVVPATTAEAGIHVRLAGRVSGSVRIRVPRVRLPRPVVRWWPAPYVVYQPTYVGEGAYVAPPQPVGPSAYGAVAPRAPLTRLAVGGSLGLTTLVDKNNEAIADRGERGVVVHGRFANHWLLEGSLRQSVEPATDARRNYVGAGVIGEFSPWSALSPYAVAAIGRETNSEGGYAEIGGGLRVHLGPNLQLNADLRTGVMAQDAGQGGMQAADPYDLRFNKLQLAALVRF